jgi:simple sugar transport system permease protein
MKEGGGTARGGWKPRLAAVGREAVPPVAAVALTILLLAAVMLMVNVSPAKVFGALLQGTFGTRYGFCLMLAYSVPMTLAGLSVAIAIRAGLFTIGAEGQLQIGGLFALIGALVTGNAVIGLVLGILAGGAWGAIAGFLKAWKGINEIITTMMLNFIAMYAVNNAILGPLGRPEASHPCTQEIAAAARLPLMVAGTRLHVGFLFAVAACVLFYLMFRYTAFGFRLRVIGANLQAARYAGTPARLYQFLAMLISGCVAGLAGGTEVLGMRYYLSLNWSRGWGWPGIAIAFLARGSPLAVLPIGIFYGILDAGSVQVQAATGLPSALVQLIQGVPVVLLIVIQTVQQNWMKRVAVRG